MSEGKTAIVKVESIHRDNDRSLGFAGSGGRWNLRKNAQPNWADIRIGKTLAVEYHTESFEYNGKTTDMKWIDHFELTDAAPLSSPATAAKPVANATANPSIEKQTIIKALAPMFGPPEGEFPVGDFIKAVNQVYLGVFADPLGAAMAQAKQTFGGEVVPPDDYDPADEADEFAKDF
jgi:hypothetical protein